MSDADAPVYDVAVVGAGPAGLMAALKSALLFHSCVVLDKGRRTSRAFWVPNMDNVPGYPQGVSGRRLLADLRAQVEHAEAVADRRFVTYEEPVEITGLARDGNGAYTLTGHRIVGRSGEGDPVRVRARTVVLATGVVDRQPYIGPEDYGIRAILPYANKGLADYCLLCDGHEVRDERVAVLGISEESVEIAKTLRDHFGAREVVLVMCIPCATGAPGHHAAEHAELLGGIEAAGLRVIDKRISDLEGLKEDRIGLVFEDGTREQFDRAWVSLGWYALNNDLARQAGAALDEEGYVRTTEDCEVVDEHGDPVEGLFCVGDLRSETWNQVPIAMGDAESAVIHAFAFRL